MSVASKKYRVFIAVQLMLLEVLVRAIFKSDCRKTMYTRLPRAFDGKVVMSEKRRCVVEEQRRYGKKVTGCMLRH